MMTKLFIFLFYEKPHFFYESNTSIRLTSIGVSMKNYFYENFSFYENHTFYELNQTRSIRCGSDIFGIFTVHLFVILKKIPYHGTIFFCFIGTYDDCI